jgi:hypothetical protein
MVLFTKQYFPTSVWGNGVKMNMSHETYTSMLRYWQLSTSALARRGTTGRRNFRMWESSPYTTGTVKSRTIWAEHAACMEEGEVHTKCCRNK